MLEEKMVFVARLKGQVILWHQLRDMLSHCIPFLISYPVIHSCIPSAEDNFLLDTPLSSEEKILPYKNDVVRFKKKISLTFLRRGDTNLTRNISP